MNKKECIQYVNSFKSDSFLNLSNTSFSNINKGKAVFWFNINPTKFEKDHNILCLDKKEVVLIHLPRTKINSLIDMFKRRSDNGLIDIEIPIKGEFDYLKDIKSEIDLRSYAIFYRLIDVSKNDIKDCLVANNRTASNDDSENKKPVLSFFISIGTIVVLLLITGLVFATVLGIFKD